MGGRSCYRAWEQSPRAVFLSWPAPGVATTLNGPEALVARSRRKPVSLLDVSTQVRSTWVDVVAAAASDPGALSGVVAQSSLEYPDRPVRSRSAATR